MPLGFAIEDSDVSSFTLSSSAHIASATGREFMLGECRTGPLAAWRFGGRIVGLVDDRSRVDSWDLRTPSCALMAKQRTKPPRSCRAGDCVVCRGASRECTAAAFCALQHRQRICTVDFAIAPFLPQPLDRSPARAGSGSRHACAHLKRGGCAVRFHRQRRETHACQRQQAPHCLRFLAPSLPLVLRCTRFVRTASYILLVIICFFDEFVPSLCVGMLSRKFKKESGTALGFSRRRRGHARLLKPMAPRQSLTLRGQRPVTCVLLSPFSACPPLASLAPPSRVALQAPQSRLRSQKTPPPPPATSIAATARRWQTAQTGRHTTWSSSAASMATWRYRTCSASQASRGRSSRLPTRRRLKPPCWSCKKHRSTAAKCTCRCLAPRVNRMELSKNLPFVRPRCSSLSASLTAPQASSMRSERARRSLPLPPSPAPPRAKTWRYRGSS
jgi:hypothetical protein